MDLKNDRDKLVELANLMNEQSETPIIVTDDLAYVFDPVLEPEEVEFLLKMGGGSLRRSQAEEKVNLPKEDFDRIFESLLDKGHIADLESENGDDQPVFHLMSIFPGWFELYLMRGSETPDRKEFSRRLSKYFSLAADFDPEIINAVMRDTAPHRSIAVVNPPEPKMISVDQEVRPPVNEIYPAHSISNILEQLDDDEVITLGHCFCRQQRKMDEDPCRIGMPEESCMGLGPAAEHLIKRGIARRITKEEAVQFIKDVEAKGAVHQVGRLVPLKDFNSKLEVDVICNCCWDCCGAFGNYNRGNTPFVLKAYYLAEIPDRELCTGCGICEEYCPVRAISVGEEGVAEINSEMCCGCGLCAFHCADEAVYLRPFEREVFLPILEGSQRRIFQ
ncbi:MAG: 4Fe-4S binding protein [Deltaproteobacteria bacterium]|nr:4Fe-4S binding protein [Deltaproteobacteria bacterium]